MLNNINIAGQYSHSLFFQGLSVEQLPFLPETNAQNVGGILLPCYDSISNL